MLTSLILTLKSPSEALLPANLGRAGQALFLRLLNEDNPALATELHNLNGLKPFTISNLVMGKREKGSVRVTAEQTGWIRFTGLNRAVSDFLLQLAQSPPSHVELDNHLFGVEAATLDSSRHPWAGAISYQEFAAPFLLGQHSNGKRPGKIELEFVSPTTFRSGQQYLPFPLPEQVFGSLLARWQSFAPIALNPEIKRFAQEMVMTQRYQLRTRSMPYKHAQTRQDQGQQETMANSQIRKFANSKGTTQVGFVGKVSFSMRNRDRYWLAMLYLLSHYAFYSGVGYQTTAGLGQVRVCE